MSNPFDFFDAIYCITCDHRAAQWQAAQREFARFDIVHRVERFSATESDAKHGFDTPTGEQRHRATAFCHLAIVERARRRNLENVLIFEDDVAFLDQGEQVLAAAIDQLRTQTSWQLFYLGMNLRSSDLQQVADHLLLAPRGKPEKLRSTHAYAINSSIYDSVLTYHDEVLQYPDRSFPHIDSWLPMRFDCYCVYPLFSVQEQDGKADKFLRNFERRFRGEASLLTRIWCRLWPGGFGRVQPVNRR